MYSNKKKVKNFNIWGKYTFLIKIDEGSRMKVMDIPRVSMIKS
jgi:hypothetical protein